MCGRFAFYSPTEAVASMFGVPAFHAVEPRYNIAPTQYVAAIRTADSRQRELVMLRWGLVPFWAKDVAMGSRMINARVETVAEKPAYRAAWRKRRCLVLADGFYEWRKEHTGKTPWFISPANGEPFAFAGLWESWKNPDSGEDLQTATIITCAANEFMQQLHQRMPVVLQPESAARWLSGELGSPDELAGIAPRMQAWPVSRNVNNARNEGEQLTLAAGAPLPPG